MGLSLVVLDLDTAVLDPEGAIHRADRDAIQLARARGVVFAYASCRRFASIVTTLRACGLDGWIIGCDGAQLGLTRGERMISRNTIASAIALRAREVLVAHRLEPFVVTSDGVHGTNGHAEAARRLLGPAADVYLASPPLLSEIQALVSGGDDAKVGAATSVLDALAPTRIRAYRYPVDGETALRVRACRSTRARAIRDVAARVKVRRPSIAYIGGASSGYVDRSPFDELAHVYLPRGFAPDLAPHAERLWRAADEGAIAEALERWSDANARELRAS